MESIVKLLGIELPVPNYMTLCMGKKRFSNMTDFDRIKLLLRTDDITKAPDEYRRFWFDGLNNPKFSEKSWNWLNLFSASNQKIPYGIYSPRSSGHAPC
jgi:hypothetical protein